MNPLSEFLFSKSLFTAENITIKKSNTDLQANPSTKKKIFLWLNYEVTFKNPPPLPSQ